MESQPNPAAPKVNQQPSQESRVPPISPDTARGLAGNVVEEEDRGGAGWDEEDWGDIDVSLAHTVYFCLSAGGGGGASWDGGGGKYCF